MAWEKLLSSREKGGVEIGSLRAQKIALLSKWWWRFHIERDAMQRKVIVALHGPWGNLDDIDRRNKKNGTWKTIAHLQKDITPFTLHFNTISVIATSSDFG